MKRRSLLAAAAGSTTAIAGCFGPFASDDSVDQGDPEDVVETIEAQTREFDPQVVAIEPGEGVEWENVSDNRHEIGAEDYGDGATDWEFDMEIQPGETTHFVFDEEGRYDFKCWSHSYSIMCGSVFVGDVEIDGEHLPCVLPGFDPDGFGEIE